MKGLIPGFMRTRRVRQDGLMLIALLLVWCSQALASGLPDDIGAGELFMIEQDTQAYVPALALTAETEARVSGLLADTRLVQRFRNDTDAWREAVYVFPLPENAAVYAMHIRVGEREIVGEVQEKQTAKATYQRAKQQGKHAALVEQERPNLFTNSVANIPPHEEIVVELRYQQRLEYRSEGFELRIPMTSTPRYIPGHPLNMAEAPLPNASDVRDLLLSPTTEPLVAEAGSGWAVGTDQVPDAARITPPLMTPQGMVEPDGQTASHYMKLNVQIDAGLPLASWQSESHTLHVSNQGHLYDIRPDVEGDRVPMDRDFVLRWQPETGQSPQAAVFKERVGNEDYALVMLMPPKGLPESATLPREMIFVIDTSGSMEGTSIVQARNALLQGVRGLTARDRFNVIQFNSRTSQLFAQPVIANASNLQHAETYIRRLVADGGTEMAAALDAALSAHVEPGYLRQVLFITDGSVGNEEALFSQIVRQLGEARLFTLGIGSAPNAYFMRKAAEFGRGRFAFAANAESVQTQVSALLARMASPVLSDLQLSFDADASASPEAYPPRVPDVYQGDPMVLVMRAENLPDQLTLSALQVGSVRDERALWQRSVRLDVARESVGVARFWARQKIESLLNARVVGGNQEKIKAEVIAVAVEFSLMSPYTSFVAVDKAPVRPEGVSELQAVVPQLIPAGQVANLAQFPQTATSSRLYLWLGAMLLGCLILFRMSGMERAREVI
ncbi:MAG: marine proteobacterial sortase target protein [Hahellaceae bacterium]|nr:marine proteobacterial sortase target protein [Hahellaceae bacterium]MCP5169274.1 marine proteobacterial sortase target protein [Hahellaceae bacterium]